MGPARSGWTSERCRGRALGTSVAELGTLGHGNSQGVIDSSLPSRKRLDDQWTMQDPDDYLRTFRNAVPALPVGPAIAGVEHVRIDASTSLRSLHNELRTNEVYHLLTNGLTG